MSRIRTGDPARARVDTEMRLGYIEEIRGLIGARPLILVAGGAVVTDPDERLLLCRRADSGEWAFPGGYMEPGETVEDTVRREVREETGLALGPLQLLDVFSGPGMFVRYPNGDEVHTVTVAFVAKEFSGALRGDAEVTALRFFSPEEILRLNVGASTRRVLERYLQLRHISY